MVASPDRASHTWSRRLPVPEPAERRRSHTLRLAGSPGISPAIVSRVQPADLSFDVQGTLRGEVQKRSLSVNCSGAQGDQTAAETQQSPVAPRDQPPPNQTDCRKTF